MTIKQLGGVFGRNPTFNDVTIEGELTFDGDIDINSDLKVNGDLDVVGSITADNTSNIGRIELSTGTTSFIQPTNTGLGNMFIRSTADGVTYQGAGVDSGTTYAWRPSENGTQHLGVSNKKWNNLYLAGNVIVDSGSGIDFSATAGTGTSELLDDYEEGAWTPGLSGYGPTPTTAQGTYIKVGGMVMAGFKIVLNGSDASQFRINNLPFVAGSAGGPDYGDGGYITFTDSGVTDIRLISDGSDDVLAYDSSGASISYTSVGATAEIKGTIIYSTV